MANPLLLAYNLDETTLRQLEALCLKQRIGFCAVPRDQFSLPIGILAGIPVAARPACSPQSGFCEPMLVMCHMLSPQLDAFLAGMRKDGIPRIALKAVMTPSNVAWNAMQLRNELSAEHEAMQRSARRK